ncbi:MAG TPA: LysM peptidoglycan-binding domain-containing protein [Anaerolineae bacterium]|nr:LysM peptidoglycan-binding domain-containing protein [Anaerolineae bacterium]
MLKRSLACTLTLFVALLVAPPRPVGASGLAQDSGVVHTVQPGENLFRISLRYGVSLDALVRANGLADAGSVYAGQRLIIPAAGSTAAPTPAANPPATSSSTHIVQPGENLYRIGLRYGVTAAQLQTANQLAGNTIFVGQQLRIPSSAAVATTPSAAPTASGAAREVVVDLSDQRVYVYENGSLVRTMVASTGVAATPTVLGAYQVYARYSSQTMYGPGYYLPDVPYVQYFYQAYALHGTYWHNNFGVPMSRGCVNLTIADAEWLYGWATMGTLVRVVS